MTREQYIERAKRFCRAAFRAYELRTPSQALDSCELAPVRAARCYAAILRSMGRKA